MTMGNVSWLPCGGSDTHHLDLGNIFPHYFFSVAVCVVGVCKSLRSEGGCPEINPGGLGGRNSLAACSLLAAVGFNFTWPPFLSLFFFKYFFRGSTSSSFSS